ncbi:hypothetical protein WJX74_010450 [Apatococcus lobatus]|uniref:peptidylprolyl isomerase n=1 Tax=Apatococcus lobatus TaxID=904363 RepID=A0AAW1RU48_9CHLO
MHSEEGQLPEADRPTDQPSAFENVTEDGGVRKKVLTSGFGDCPLLHSKCLVRYVGRLASTREVFLDTDVESRDHAPFQLIAGRESAAKDVGLSKAVQTMRRGEKSLIEVEPQYGYGSKGNFSFPSVPPEAKLIYEMELVDSEPVNESKERGEMLYEERLEAAERRRLEGNELFKAGQCRDALGKYALALSYVDEDFMMQLEGRHLAQAQAIKVPVHLNMAAAQLREKDPHTAAFNCSEVLQMDPGNAKAFFRRAKARHMLSQTELALEDIQSAQEKAPGDKSIAREAAALQRTIKQEKAAASKLFKGQFLSNKALAEIFQHGPDQNPELHSRKQLPAWQQILAAVQAWFGRLLRWQPNHQRAEA